MIGGQMEGNKFLYTVCHFPNQTKKPAIHLQNKRKKNKERKGGCSVVTHGPAIRSYAKANAKPSATPLAFHYYRVYLKRTEPQPHMHLYNFVH